MGLKLASETIDTMDAVTTQWTQIFFKRDKSGIEDSAETVCTIVEDSNTEADQNAASIDTEDESMSTLRRTSYARSTKFMTLKEQKLEGLVGSDAVQYLRFQKYIIIYIFFTTVVSLVVILPLNFQGTQLGNATDFGHTTLANLNPINDKDAFILWIHVAIAFLMFPAAIFFMRRFSIGLKITDTNLKITRTLAVENIPEKLCNIEDILG